MLCIVKASGIITFHRYTTQCALRISYLAKSVILPIEEREHLPDEFVAGDYTLLRPLDHRHRYQLLQSI